MCLPYAYKTLPSLPNNTTLTAVGWGSTEFSLSASYDKKSWILQKTSVYTNNNLGACKAGDTYKVCVKGTWNGVERTDTCQRDSGGALYGYQLNTGRQHCFGVVR